MQIYAISLAGAHARRERLLNHLGSLNLIDSVEIIEGVHGASIEEPELRRMYDPKLAIRSAGRPFTRGEIGCALSHLKAYRQMLDDGNKWSLILEDDALLDESAPALLRHLSDWLESDSARVVTLGSLRKFMVGGAQKIYDGHNLVNLVRAWNAHGYVINEAAALVMLGANYPVKYMADDWMAFKADLNIDVRGVDPYCIGVNELSAESHLESERAERRKAKALSYRARKLVNKIIALPKEYLFIPIFFGIGSHSEKARK